MDLTSLSDDEVYDLFVRECNPNSPRNAAEVGAAMKARLHATRPEARDIIDHLVDGTFSEGEIAVLDTFHPWQVISVWSETTARCSLEQVLKFHSVMAPRVLKAMEKAVVMMGLKTK